MCEKFYLILIADFAHISILVPELRPVAADLFLINWKLLLFLLISSLGR